MPIIQFIYPRVSSKFIQGASVSVRWNASHVYALYSATRDIYHILWGYNKCVLASVFCRCHVNNIAFNGLKHELVLLKYYYHCFYFLCRLSTDVLSIQLTSASGLTVLTLASGVLASDLVYVWNVGANVLPDSYTVLLESSVRLATLFMCGPWAVRFVYGIARK